MEDLGEAAAALEADVCKVGNHFNGQTSLCSVLAVFSLEFMLCAAGAQSSRNVSALVAFDVPM